MLKQTLLAAIATAAIALPAAAQESYVIGLTGAMTGPAAGTLGPAVEGLRIEFAGVVAGGPQLVAGVGAANARNRREAGKRRSSPKRDRPSPPHC